MNYTVYDCAIMKFNVCHRSTRDRSFSIAIVKLMTIIETSTLHAMTHQINTQGEDEEEEEQEESEKEEEEDRRGDDEVDVGESREEGGGRERDFPRVERRGEADVVRHLRRRLALALEVHHRRVEQAHRDERHRDEHPVAPRPALLRGHPLHVADGARAGVDAV